MGCISHSCSQRPLLFSNVMPAFSEPPLATSNGKENKAVGKQGQISTWSLWVCPRELERAEKMTGPFTVTMLPLRDSIVVTNTAVSLAQILIWLCVRFSIQSLVIVLWWRDLANDTGVTSFLWKMGFSQKLGSAKCKWPAGKGKYGQGTVSERVQSDEVKHGSTLPSPLGIP